MALVFPARSDATNAPRVRFKSQTWEVGKPELANTKGAKLVAGSEDVQLYLPGGFQESYKANWNREDLVTALTDINDIRGWKASGYEAARTVFETKALGGLSASARYGTGATTFPGKFLIFDSADAVTLNFNFELIPRNAGEAKQISEICKLFRRKLLPVFNGGLLRFPDVWDIQFFGITGVGYPDTPGEYAGMALIAVDTSYNGGTSALTFNDGHPVATELKLSFQSIKQSYIDSGA